MENSLIVLPVGDEDKSNVHYGKREAGGVGGEEWEGKGKNEGTTTPISFQPVNLIVIVMFVLVR